MLLPVLLVPLGRRLRLGQLPGELSLHGSELMIASTREFLFSSNCGLRNPYAWDGKTPNPIRYGFHVIMLGVYSPYAGEIGT